MAQVRIVWDDAAVKMTCASPSTPVGRAMNRLADELVSQIKRRTPVYTGPPRIGPTPGHPRQVARQPGTLRSSVRKIRQPDGSFLVGPTDIVGGQFLGPILEKGSRPHTITSHGPWPLYNAAIGRYFGRTVRHPGSRPRPFIAPAVAAMNGRTVRAR